MLDEPGPARAHIGKVVLLPAVTLTVVRAGSRITPISLAATATPVPVNCTTWGLPGALSIMESSTVLFPGPCGKKRTPGVRVEPGLMVIGGKNTLSAVKVASNGVKLEPEMLNGAVPGLLICKGWGNACGVVTPTADGPRSIGDGGVVLKPGVP